MKDYSKDINFWKRLKSFAENIQCNDCCGEEEKEMVLNVCNRTILKIEETNKTYCTYCGKQSCNGNCY